MRSLACLVLVLLVAGVGISPDARAQNRPTRLVVAVASSGEPVEGVRAEAEGVSFMTDELGRVGWQGLPPGPVRVSIRSAGYAPLDTTLSLGAGATLVARLELVPISLAPVTVEAVSRNEVRLRARGFYERREGRTGVFLTRAEIENRGAAALSDVFTGLAGMRVDRAGGVARLVSTRSPGCTPQVFLDGTQANYLGGQIDSFPLGDVAAVEVYRGSSEIPMEYARLSTARPCGAVLIWTQIENRRD